MTFNAQALANTVWSFEKAGVSHPLLFEKVANHIVALDQLERLSTDRIFPTQYWHLQKLEYHILLCLRKWQLISFHLIILKDFNSQNLSNTV